MIGGPTVKLNIFSCLSSFSPFFAALFYNRLILLNYLKNDRATNLQSCIAFEASGDLDQCLGKERIRPVGAAPPPRIRPGADLLQVKPPRRPIVSVGAASAAKDFAAVHGSQLKRLLRPGIFRPRRVNLPVGAAPRREFGPGRTSYRSNHPAGQSYP